MQVELRRGQGPVPGDLPQYVHRDTRVGHPGQTRMTQVRMGLPTCVNDLR
jgi:hypothetical protein